MKKTNFAFFSLAKRFLLPIGVFCFLLLSASDVSAQSFKTPTDASIAAKEAIFAASQLMPNAGTQYNEEQKQAELNVRVFNMFLETVDALNDTEAAYNSVVQKLETAVANQTTAATTTIKGGMQTSTQALFQAITG